MYRLFCQCKTVYTVARIGRSTTCPIFSSHQQCPLLCSIPIYSEPVFCVGICDVDSVCSSFALRADQASQFCCRFARDEFEDRCNSLLKCVCCLLQILQKLFLWWSVTCEASESAGHNQGRGSEKYYPSH